MGWIAARLGGWAGVAGLPAHREVPAAEPFAAMARRDWAAAADAFGVAGWDDDRALMLSPCHDTASLRGALGVARRLRAQPLARRVAARMPEA